MITEIDKEMVLGVVVAAEDGELKLRRRRRRRRRTGFNRNHGCGERRRRTRQAADIISDWGWDAVATRKDDAP